MKKQLVVIVFLLCSCSALAQEQEQNPQLKDSQLSVNVGLPFISVDYEKQLAESDFTLHSGLSFQFGFFGSSGAFNYYILPFLAVAPRSGNS